MKTDCTLQTKNFTCLVRICLSFNSFSILYNAIQLNIIVPDYIRSAFSWALHAFFVFHPISTKSNDYINAN